MSDNSRIEWCDATLSPAYGCSPISPACDHCYAARMAGRLGNLTEGAHRNGKWTGKINLFPERMRQALKWKKPRRIFVGSMTDLFHDEIENEFLDRVFAYMALASQHTFMLLTKRPEWMEEYIAFWTPDGKINPYRWADAVQGIIHPKAGSLPTWPLPNVWLGVTAENQEQADARIPILLDTPAVTRFVSVEPMLGPVDLHDGLWRTERDWTDEYESYPREPRLDWIICGGETGPDSRPMHPDWVCNLRDECVAAGVPFFMKKMSGGGRPPEDLLIREFPNANA